MEFCNVFKSLQELFPQIDARLLRAVAYEHDKDVDAAVGSVLEEIIPFFTKKEAPSTPTEDANGYDDVSGGSGGGPHNAVVEPDGSLIDWNVGPEVVEPELTRQVVEKNMTLNADGYSGCDPVVMIDDSGYSTFHIEAYKIAEVEEIGSTVKCTESCIETLSDNISSLTPEDSRTVDVDVHNDLDLNQQPEDFDNCLEDGVGKDVSQNGDQARAIPCEENSVDDPNSLTMHDQMPSTSSSSVPALSNGQENISENNEVILSSDDASLEIGVASKVLCIVHGSRMDESLSQSKQVQIVNVLEEMISGARNNKKELFSSMESVMSLMREVENKERAAELAKEDASMSGTSTQEKVEELKKMLKHAKAANDMHAGEVYGEKAILSTELRELQSRVLSLSESRDKSLAVLAEMRQTLEVRLAAAEYEIKCAEQEKWEKEKSARKALVDQELIMEKVVQESNKLKQQAEDNEKLQEFLLDRGHVVNVLQGEIAVICKDVMLLKEKLDERIPFSKSLSPSQTSFTLAASRSSMRSSMIQEQVDPVPDQSESVATQEKGPVSSYDENFPEDSFEEDEILIEDKATKDDRKTLQDDGWEIFDNRDLQAE